MATANLLCHKGGKYVSRAELVYVPCPEPTRTWFPINHSVVANSVVSALAAGGYEVKRDQWALSGPAGEQMFGVLDMSCQIQGREISLAVGVRNSVNQTFPLGFCAGSRVFVCDNLAFSAELMVRRRHTVNGMRDFTVNVSRAVGALEGFIYAEKVRVERWQKATVTYRQRDEVILRALGSGVFPKKMLPDIFREHVRPQYTEFNDMSAYGLFNNFTTVMRERAAKRPNEHSWATQELTKIIDEVVFDLKPEQYRIVTADDHTEMMESEAQIEA